jgi:hypothetical protein
MKTFTKDEFNQRIKDLWDEMKKPHNEMETPADQVNFILEGEIIDEADRIMGEGYDTWNLISIIIKDAKHQITSSELCSIFDEGNHCLSNGTIFYEDEYTYIQWSNKGHI